MDLFSKLKMPPLVDQIREAGVYPYFHELQSRQDTTVIMEGKRRIMLGSNNYLGLTVNEEVCQAAHDALERYGTGCSGSRFLNGTLRLHLDNDEVGRAAAKGIMDGLPGYTVLDEPPICGKDVNEQLQLQVGRMKKKEGQER